MREGPAPSDGSGPSGRGGEGAGAHARGGTASVDAGPGGGTGRGPGTPAAGAGTAASGIVARHLLSQPWRYWRYPRGARTMEEPLLYGERQRRPSPPAADPALQVKESTEDLK